MKFEVSVIYKRLDPVAAANRLVQNWAERAVAKAKATTAFKDRTGTTRRSIRWEFRGPGEAAVLAGGAAAYLEHGTAAHTIRPRNKRILRFVKNGAVVWARAVRHPGIKATGFLAQAVRKTVPRGGILS